MFVSQSLFCFWSSGNRHQKRVSSFLPLSWLRNNCWAVASMSRITNESSSAQQCLFCLRHINHFYTKDYFNNPSKSIYLNNPHYRNTIVCDIEVLRKLFFEYYLWIVYQYEDFLIETIIGYNGEKPSYLIYF